VIFKLKVIHLFVTSKWKRVICEWWQKNPVPIKWTQARPSLRPAPSTRIWFNKAGQVARDWLHRPWRGKSVII